MNEQQMYEQEKQEFYSDKCRYCVSQLDEDGICIENGSECADLHNNIAIVKNVWL